MLLLRPESGDRVFIAGFVLPRTRPNSQIDLPNSYNAGFQLLLSLKARVAAALDFHFGWRFGDKRTVESAL